MSRSYTHRKRRIAKREPGNIYYLDTSMLGKHLQDVSLFYSKVQLLYSQCDHLIRQKYGDTALMPAPQNTEIISLEQTCLPKIKLENKLPDSAESLGMPAQVRTFFRLLPGRLILLTALLVPAIDSNIVKMLRSCIGLFDQNHNEATNRLVSLQREQLLNSVGKQQYALSRDGAQALISFLLDYKEMLAAFDLHVPESNNEPNYIASAIGNIFMARVHPARKKASSPHRLAITTIYIYTLIYPRPADSGDFFVTPESPLRWDLPPEAIGNNILDIDFRMFPLYPGRRVALEVDCGTEQIAKSAKGTSLLDKLTAYTAAPIRDEDRILRDIIFLVTTARPALKKHMKSEKGIAFGGDAARISPAKYRQLVDLQIYLAATIYYFEMFPDQIDMSTLKQFFKRFLKQDAHRLSSAMQSNLNLLKTALEASEQDGVNDLSGWLDWLQQIKKSSSAPPDNSSLSLSGPSKNSRVANILSAILDCPADSPIRKAIKTGTLIAAVPYKSWNIMHILEPEQWFGFERIQDIFEKLYIFGNDNKYLSRKNKWTFKYNHPLLRCSSRKTHNDFYSSYDYDYYVRLAICSEKTTIAIENVSHDAGGLIRARDIISSMPGNLGRNVLLVLLCADDYILADGTSALKGGLCIDNSGRLINFPDCESQRGGIQQEYAYYYRTLGRKVTKQKVDEYAPRPDPDHTYYVLPFLTGIACDFVLIPYSQFLNAANGRTSLVFTVLSEHSKYLRFGDTISNSVRSFRHLIDRSRVDNI